MAKRAKPAARRPAATKMPKVASGELVTLLDFVRYATSSLSAIGSSIRPNAEC